jgi:hypothetical protein
MKGNHVIQTFGKEIREGHLGGCVSDGDPATYYPHMWEHMVNTYKINSVMDIGCGCGHHAKYFQSLGCDIIAVDGSTETKKNSVVPDHQIVHDYELGNVHSSHDIEFLGETGSNIRIDLAWSCEFVEHVWEKYSQNFIDDFKLCKYVAMTHATPGQGGYHHVNEQPKEYWIDVLDKNGFTYLEDDLIILKEKCKKDWEFMTTNKSYENVVTSWDQTPLINYRSYFIDTGLFFVNRNYDRV